MWRGDKSLQQPGNEAAYYIPKNDTYLINSLFLNAHNHMTACKQSGEGTGSKIQLIHNRVDCLEDTHRGGPENTSRPPDPLCVGVSERVCVHSFRTKVRPFGLESGTAFSEKIKICEADGMELI